MRQFSSVELRRIKLLTENSIEIALLEPTRTGLLKSILDATGPLRIHLSKNNIHDYEKQKQGPSNKVNLKAYFIDNRNLITSIASLYRPLTKNGDPRIWFSKLQNYTSANDILGIIVHQNNLYVLNVTKIDVEFLLNPGQDNPFQSLIKEINSRLNIASSELLNLLSKIAKLGPIPALLKADTAIGRTLEHLLGIEINSSKKPDYKGIEIKSFREERSNRKTLFAQVPDWTISKFKSSNEILNNFGYDSGGFFRLYCTVSTITRNRQGLILKFIPSSNYLLENSNAEGIGDFVIWRLEKLHERLLEKHNETFWVSAESLYIDGLEHFKFKTVEHTMKPIVTQFDLLLQQGDITLDHMIKKISDNNVKEKGPFFKIKPKSLNLLFPPSKIYHLDK